MFKSKKKAQISIEALILVGIIVLGATIFASMYLNRIARGISDSTNLDSGLSDLFYDSYGSGTDSSSEGGEDDPITPPISGEIGLTLELVPPIHTQINQSFGIKASVLNFDMPAGNTIDITKIKVKSNDFYSPNCRFGGTPIPVTGYTPSTTISLQQEAASNNYSIVLNDFSCIVDEGAYNQVYTFQIFAELSGDPNNKDEKSIDKTITKPTAGFIAYIASPENAIYYIDDILVLSSKFDWLSSPTEDISCTWTAVDETGAAQLISNLCNDVINPDYFFIENEKYKIYLKATSASYFSSDYKEVIFIDPNTNPFLLFDPPEQTYVDSEFSIEYMTRRPINTLADEYLSLVLPSDCRYDTRYSTTIYNPFSFGGNSETIYGYEFSANCSTPGTKTITGNVIKSTFGIGGIPETIESATDNYNIISGTTTPGIDFNVSFGFSGNDLSNPDNLEYNFKDKDDDTLYFAAPEPYVDYNIYQGQDFVISPIIINDDNTIQNCRTTITSQGSLSTTIDFGITSCAIPQPAIINNPGTYEIKVTGYRTRAPQTYTKTRLMKVNSIPFYIISSEPNNEILLSNSPTTFTVTLNNSAQTTITADINLFKMENTGGTSSNFASKSDDTLYFAAPPNLTYNNYDLVTLNCQPPYYTTCSGTATLPPGTYIGRAVAKSSTDPTQQSIKYSHFKVIDYTNMTTGIIGLDTPYHGTENNYIALLYILESGNYTWYYPESCQNWNVTKNTVNSQTDNCLYTITPAELGLQTMSVSTRLFDGSNWTPGTKPITVIEDTIIVYPNSVILRDTNSDNENFSVHLRGNKVKLSALQKLDSETYGAILSDFTCAWKYKLTSSSTWTTLAETPCNQDTLILNSENFNVNTYNVHLDVKYNGTISYSKDSSFKIRECIVGGHKCQFNGFCETDGRCSYVQFPVVSMDLAKNHISSSIPTIVVEDDRWYNPLFSGIGHSCYYTGNNDPQTQLFNCVFISRGGHYASAKARNFLDDTLNYNNSNFKSCDSTISSIPLLKHYYSDKVVQTLLTSRGIDTDYDQATDSKIIDFSFNSEDSSLLSHSSPELNENDFHNSISESSPVTIIATGLAADNIATFSSNYGVYGEENIPGPQKVTELFYYSLNNNKNIRRFALRNCSSQRLGYNFGSYEICSSYFTFSNIDSSLSSKTINGTTYNYYYDYPQIARKDNKVAVVGTRYIINPNDSNILRLEYYILYTSNIDETTVDWDLYTYDNLTQFMPLEARGNTLLFDSEGKLHYSLISGASQLVDNDGILRFTNNLENSSSQPMELIFNPVTEEILIDSIFPNPGIENSQKNYFFSDNGTYVAQPYESTTIYSGEDSIERFKSYSQQAINTDKNWMAQVWVSYPITRYQTNSLYGNGFSNNRVIRAAFSNDNGKHWTAPVELITQRNYPTAVYNANIGPVLAYFTITKDIFPINNNIGRFGIMFKNYPGDASGDYEDGYDVTQPYFMTFDVNFNLLNITYGAKEYEQYLIKNSSGTLVSTRAGNIDYSTYRKPYIISKISNDQNIFDWDYINSNCVLFNSNQTITESLLSRPCAMQYEQFFEPKLINVTNNINEDVHGCGPMDYASSGGYSSHICFKEGTKVYTPQGYRNIEDIKSGDKVYSLKEETKELEITTVASPIIHKNTTGGYMPKLYKVKLSNGITLFVTENHSLYVSNIKDYKQLRDIASNDKLFYYNTKTKEFEDVKIINKEMQDDQDTYYNLSLIENHNYLSEGIVAHNDRKHFAPIDYSIPCYENCTWFDSFFITSFLMDKLHSYFGAINITETEFSWTQNMSAYANPAIPIGNGVYIVSINWPDGTVGYGITFGSSTGQTLIGYNLGDLGSGVNTYCPTC